MSDDSVRLKLTGLSNKPGLFFDFEICSIFFFFRHLSSAIYLHDIFVVKVIGLNYTILIKFEKPRRLIFYL